MRVSALHTQTTPCGPEHGQEGAVNFVFKDPQKLCFHHTTNFFPLGVAIFPGS